MTRSLASKLTLSIWIVSLISVASVAFFAVRVTQSEFDVFINKQERDAIAAQLATYYSENNSWQGVEKTFSADGAQRTFAVVDQNQRVIVGGAGFRPDRRLPPNSMRNATPIEANGRTVGFLVVGQNSLIRERLLNPELDFLSRITRAMVLAAVGATAVSLLIGFFLARTLTKPIQELTHATQAVAKGDLQQKVPIRSEDELGELAIAFNQMSDDLTQARVQRRQLTADIAHDLRTPLSLILGHSEALSDGILPATPEALHVIHDEAQRLNRLIEDLRTLSLAETGGLSMNNRPVAPKLLLERAALAHAHVAQQKSINIILQLTDRLPNVDADPDRIAQILDNFLQNALRYTPQNGQIELAAQVNGEQPDHIQFSVKDNGSGISEADLPHLFHRFYRAEKSRYRQEGGSGLGLAIAKSIVERVNGRIWVESTLGQGTTFFFTLPIA